MGKTQEHELITIAAANKETSAPEAADTINVVASSDASQNRGFEWRVQIALYILLVLVGQSAAVLLGRLYFDKGGNSKWMATLVQVAGFPALFPLYKFFRKEKTPNYTPTTHLSPLKIASVYTFFGLFLAAMCMLYSIGLKYMPVSTFSLICSSQLAFNALFALFINSQKFTSYIINSVVLLTISSTLLCFHSDSSLPKGVSRRQNVIGFICTVGCSAGYGLQLSLTQFAFQRLLRKKNSFESTVDMIVYPAIVASCAAVVGLFASGEWKTLNSEMHQFELGKLSYVMTLVWTALMWQLYSIGMTGLINKMSSLFSNAVATLGLPIVPVLAVIFFHDAMDGIKVVAMLLAIWGFVSYGYQQYLDHYKLGHVLYEDNASSL
ncbi:hypothetical protein RND81_07G161200 [Saponaria officinalis]|uniref:Probable purine permease n=1 Tax=Saponaria officinalis TaxID=3572 RepID=A0AAW1JSU5_SAPOF